MNALEFVLILTVITLLVSRWQDKIKIKKIELENRKLRSDNSQLKNYINRENYRSK